MATLTTDHSRPKPYEVRWSWYDADGKRHSRKKRFVTKKSAESHRRKVTVEREHDPQQGKESFREWAAKFTKSKEGKVSAAYLRKINGILKSSVLPEFGSTRVDQINTVDVQEYLDRIQSERNLTPATVRHHWLVVSGVLKYAVKRKAIPLNPATGVELPTDKALGRIKPEAVFLTPGEVAKLAAAMAEQDPTTPYALMVTFMAYTGLRASEVSGLNIDDVDTMRRVLHVRRTRSKVRGGWEVSSTKNSTSRRVRLPEWLALDLAAYLGAHPNRKEPSAPLWPGRKIHDAQRFKGGKGGLDWSRPWDRDAFYKRHFKPALAAAGLPERMRLHDLRHTCASILQSAGVPIEHISKQLGHRNVVVTQAIYAHVFDTDTANFMDTVAAPPSTTGKASVTQLA
ncbi:tyrosine-type recombinase/integrase [Nocardioides humi]|uniref:Site-specific integrase n=1 Tax=Nocardioides humi TaxID=449461 RepID=A0ABN2BNA9_9ACTN|nr:site-specific integrase [Nocardioides humi]